MTNKKEHLKHLEDNTVYQNVLKLFKSDEERAKAAALAEDLFLKIMEGFQATRAAAQQHPDKFTEIVGSYIHKDKDGK